jgi:uncharacterized protein
MASLIHSFMRHPIRSALVIFSIYILFTLIAILAARVLAPGFDPGFVALIFNTILVAVVLTVLGWWRIAGFNRPAEWHSLGLLLLPAVVILIPPFLGGIKPVVPGTLAYLILGYALTGFMEEAFTRGILLHVLKPSGVLRAALLSALLFGLSHLTNLLTRSVNPAIILAQAVGAFCDGFGFAALRFRTNTLWFLILLHGLHDLLLQYTRFPIIPLDVAQVTVLLIYGWIILRNQRGL